MRIKIIAFTKKGGELCRHLIMMLEKPGSVCEGYLMKDNFEIEGLSAVHESVKEWTNKAFNDTDVIIFIGATGIAVRAIAPYIKCKTIDPAVVTIDEKGKFVISLLSGHIGGGNEITKKIANMLEATPVITTATDINSKFSVDVFATENHLKIENMKAAKMISAKVLDNMPIYILDESDNNYSFPNEIIMASEKEFWEMYEKGYACCIISNKEVMNMKDNLLQLVPKDICIGIGCRKDTGVGAMKFFVQDTLEMYGLRKDAIRCIASIDLKQEEKALLELARTLDVPFVTYSSGELRITDGEFCGSSFVESVTGVDNVCERSAVRASNGGSLIVKKRTLNGITIAIARR